MLPAASASSPAPEPVYSVVTVMSGYFSMKPSISDSQTFSIDVEPASEIVPESDSASLLFSDASAVVSFEAPFSSVVVLLPHPAKLPIRSEVAGLVDKGAVELAEIKELYDAADKIAATV